MLFFKSYAIRILRMSFNAILCFRFVDTKDIVTKQHNEI